MGELSDRFAALMARLAQTDADLYRAIGAQNASMRLLVDDLAAAVPESAESGAAASSPAPTTLPAIADPSLPGPSLAALPPVVLQSGAPQPAALRLQPAALQPGALQPAAPQPAALLPPEACELKALKVRFGKLAEAQTWLESQLGPAPKKPTWAVIADTCRGGAWPPSARRAAAAAKGLTAADLDARLSALEQRLRQHAEQRFQRLEALLSRVVSALEPQERPPS
jgi:hypothetical protein